MHKISNSISNMLVWNASNQYKWNGFWPEQNFRKLFCPNYLSIGWLSSMLSQKKS
jgi:hypothetical protein